MISAFTLKCDVRFRKPTVNTPNLAAWVATVMVKVSRYLYDIFVTRPLFILY